VFVWVCAVVTVQSRMHVYCKGLFIEYVCVCTCVCVRVCVYVCVCTCCYCGTKPYAQSEDKSLFHFHMYMHIAIQICKYMCDQIYMNVCVRVRWLLP